MQLSVRLIGAGLALVALLLLAAFAKASSDCTEGYIVDYIVEDGIYYADNSTSDWYEGRYHIAVLTEDGHVQLHYIGTGMFGQINFQKLSRGMRFSCQTPSQLTDI